MVLFTLVKFRKNDVKGSQIYLLLTLYLDEVAYSIASVTINLLSRAPNITPQIRKHLTICRRALMLLMYYLIMIYITIDRFLVIFLNIEYPLLWPPRKAVYLVLGSFLLDGLICICSSKMIQQKLKQYFRGKRRIDQKRRKTFNREVTCNI